MISPDDVIKACEILGLPEEATMDEVKLRYRYLLKKWHPDKSGCSDDEISKEKTRQIVWAYEVVVTYCNNYKYSFLHNDIKRQLSNSSSTWWMERFGRDPLWGKPE